MKHVLEKLPAWQAGELEPAVHADVEAHLAACPACRSEADRLGELWRGLETARPAPGGDAWPGIRARTFGRERTEWFFGRGPLTRLGWATATVAAGLALGLLVPGPHLTSTAAAGDDSRLVGLWLEDSALDTADGTDRVSGLWLDAALEQDGGGS